VREERSAPVAVSSAPVAFALSELSVNPLRTPETVSAGAGEGVGGGSGSASADIAGQAARKTAPMKKRESVPIMDHKIPRARQNFRLNGE
jgi:hypothetical protein